MGKVTATAYRLKSAVFNRIRWGDRTILWTMDHGLGFGNHLYLWLYAHIMQAEGRDYRVLVTDAQRPWLSRFPALAPLTIERSDATFPDQREWGHTPRLYQRFGVDYTREQLHNFIHTRLADSIPATRGDATVLNVRRGDYYTTYRAEYGMNLSGYLQAALSHVDPSETLRIVSDDPEWCAAHLKQVHRGPVAFAAHDPWQNFLEVATASTLVGTNSTFSYWGGYIGDALRGEARRVVMPWFHKRTLNDGAADQLDPRWTIITDPPGGWDEPR